MEGIGVLRTTRALRAFPVTSPTLRVSFTPLEVDAVGPALFQRIPYIRLNFNHLNENMTIVNLFWPFLGHSPITLAYF